LVRERTLHRAKFPLSRRIAIGVTAAGAAATGGETIGPRAVEAWAEVVVIAIGEATERRSISRGSVSAAAMGLRRL
jgi:hypothetical protein